MTALLLAFGAFLAWWLIGFGVLATLRADTSSLRVVLTAPMLGTAVTVLPVFLLSYAGVPIERSALPVAVVLLAGSGAVLAYRRPVPPRGVAPVLAVCAIGLLLAGWPMLELGFRWISNANDDMANYVLSATKLLHHGLLAPLDVEGLANDRNFASATQIFHSIGARPGADVGLAAFSSVTRHPPYEAFMTFILALHLCTICATAALALQAARRQWAAVVAAALIAVSPLATFGVVQQLLPQVWGLGLAAALFALLMRPELHERPGPRIADILLVGLVAAAVVLVYVELASTVALAYALYVAILVVRRELEMRAALRFWLPGLAVVVIVLNGYLLREANFLRIQTHSGFAHSAGSPFGFTLVPSALPGVLGLLTLPPSASTPQLGAYIAVAAVVLVAVAAAAAIGAARGVGAAAVLVTYAGIGILLGIRSGDFGLLKLYMYAQPFLAAGVAVWICRQGRRAVSAIAMVPLAALVAAQLSTQRVYVSRSRDPVDLHHASAGDLLPAFRRGFASAGQPVLSATENPTLGKLETASVGDKPLYLITRNLFETMGAGLIPYLQRDLRQSIQRFQRTDGWLQRSFDLQTQQGRRNDTFLDNERASALISSRNCVVALPSGSQQALNRRLLPEGSRDLVFTRCSAARNTLVFTASALGQPFYLATARKAISFYQLEPDYFYRGRTLSGFGRYVLFRVLGTSPRVRLELDLTTTLRQDGSNRLPPAAVVGATRAPLPLVGRGSARVFSPPLRPQVIAGQPYALLDMDRDGRLLRPRRSGIEALYGSSIALDPRYLTAYVRNVSLVSDADYRGLRAPSALRHFPGDLADSDLEYSGIYEDGWIAEDSFAVLASGPAANLVVRAAVLPRPGQHLDVLVNGRRVASRKVAAGSLDLRVRLPGSSSRRWIELRWAGAARLRPPDRRPAVALLSFFGLASPPSALRRLPGDLGDPGLVYSGIYKDGWLEKDSSLVLAGGDATSLVLRAQVLARKAQHLEVLLNGRSVASESVQPGLLDLHVPLPASRPVRRIELRWAGTTRIAGNDPRQAAALLELVDVAPAPSALRRLPGDLGDPGLVYSGIFKDGWLEKDSSLVLAGGDATSLVLRAQVLARKAQHLEVLLNGRSVASESVQPGLLDLHVPLPASRPVRRIELRWAGTTRIAGNDPRQAAALLKFIGLAASARAPSALAHFPGDLADPGLDYAGIYKDGWLEEDSYAVLAGGAAADLIVRAEVPPRKGQRLEVLVNGRSVDSRSVEAGLLDLRIAIPAARGRRRVELRWAGTVALRAPDTRRAAALLRFVGLAPRTSR